MNTLDHLEHLVAFELTERVPLADALWSQVNDAELSPDDAVEHMRALEPERDVDELKWQAELFAPPSEDERQQELAKVLDSRFRPTATSSPRQRAGLLLATSATGAAAAAALVIMLWPTTPDPPDRADPLPAYQLDWTPWQGPRLGPEKNPGECETRLHVDHKFQVYLRPSTAVQQKVEVAAWARSSEGDDLALTLIATLHDGGTIEIKQPISELGLTPGEWTITFVVGPPERLRDAKAVVKLEPDERPDVAVLKDSVCVVE
ncbi:MAG: hypothetical protein AAGF11_34995 [Myxococcota bacterium]